MGNELSKMDRPASTPNPYRSLKEDRPEFRLFMGNLPNASSGDHVDHVVEVWNQAEDKRFPPMGPSFKRDAMTLEVGQERIRITVLFYPESKSLKIESEKSSVE